jgi:hypothetical protein
LKKNSNWKKKKNLNNIQIFVLIFKTKFILVIYFSDVKQY